MQLSDTQERFVRRWGEMGTRWGIPRSTAMLHGLLYICNRALTPEEICGTLGLARSNVSTSLRELEDYRLVYRQNYPTSVFKRAAQMGSRVLALLAKL